MKKLYSLIRASMTSGMNIFKISSKKGKHSLALPIFLAFYLMFMFWSMANGLFEKLSTINLVNVALPLIIFSVSIMTVIEGIYKTGSLLFNCKDDQLLLSLPIKRRTVLFVRIFKFYVFELLFNSLFLVPFMLAYIRWAPTLSWTYFLTSIIMISTIIKVSIMYIINIVMILRRLNSKTCLMFMII